MKYLDILRCQCLICDCRIEFESIDKEELLDIIQHGRLNPKQTAFAKKKKRLGSSICEQCFVGKHCQSK